MEYTKLGPTGIEVSRLCFGTWRFGKEAADGTIETTREEAHDLLDTAYKEGITFIDTANTYGGGRSEQWIGEWLESHDREEFVIASKVYWTVESRISENLSRKTIRTEIEGTLDRLGTDYLDLYYIHRWDEETPVEETLATLTDLICEGKVNYLGASTMAGWKLMKALKTSDIEDYKRFQVAQPLFHAAYRDDVMGYLEVCQDQNLAVCPYSPLAGGFLTGKYKRVETDDGYEIEGPEGSRIDTDDIFESWYVSERGWHVLDAVREVADEVGATPAQVSLRWLIDHDEFTTVPIVGARTPAQLRENVTAVDVSLTGEQHDRITDARYAEGDRRWGH